MIRSTLNASIILADALSYQIPIDNNPANFNAAGLPAGLAFDPLSGVISGNPTEFGTFPVTISASNAVGADSEVLTLFIAASGPITSFTWDDIASPQVATVLFSATLCAVDAKGRTVRSFEGPVAISGPGANPTTTVGTGATTGTLPLSTYYFDARTQVIYLADEIGNAGKITALSLYVTAPSGLTLNNWTIRMKHTTLASYGAGAAWEGSDWTTVYQANETVSVTGWVTFTFSTPFSYDGLRISRGDRLANVHRPLYEWCLEGEPRHDTCSERYTRVSRRRQWTCGNQQFFQNLPLILPVIDGPLATVAVSGQPFSYWITATDSPTSYGATGLPEGLTVTSATGIISGIPVVSGVFSVGLSATNASGTGSA